MNKIFIFFLYISIFFCGLSSCNFFKKNYSRKIQSIKSEQIVEYHKTKAEDALPKVNEDEIPANPIVEFYKKKAEDALKEVSEDEIPPEHLLKLKPLMKSLTTQGVAFKLVYNGSLKYGLEIIPVENGGSKINRYVRRVSNLFGHFRIMAIPKKENWSLMAAYDRKENIIVLQDFVLSNINGPTPHAIISHEVRHAYRYFKQRLGVFSPYNTAWLFATAYHNFDAELRGTGYETGFSLSEIETHKHQLLQYFLLQITDKVKNYHNMDWKNLDFQILTMTSRIVSFCDYALIGLNDFTNAILGQNIDPNNPKTASIEESHNSATFDLNIMTLVAYADNNIPYGIIMQLPWNNNSIYKKWKKNKDDPTIKTDIVEIAKKMTEQITLDREFAANIELVHKAHTESSQHNLEYRRFVVSAVMTNSHLFSVSNKPSNLADLFSKNIEKLSQIKLLKRLLSYRSNSLRVSGRRPKVNNKKSLNAFLKILANAKLERRTDGERENYTLVLKNKKLDNSLVEVTFIFDKSVKLSAMQFSW